jgi:uncharacterized membrane protein YeaQ/YmgE (transglycosylase-associated protein family)
MTLFLNAIGWKYLSFNDLVFISAMSGAVFMIMAWLADLLMEQRSFGVVLNTILLAIGAVLGLAGLAWLEIPPTRKDFLPALFACGVSAVVFLVALAAMKRTV